MRAVEPHIRHVDQRGVHIADIDVGLIADRDDADPRPLSWRQVNRLGVIGVGVDLPAGDGVDDGLVLRRIGLTGLVRPHIECSMFPSALARQFTPMKPLGSVEA